MLTNFFEKSKPINFLLIGSGMALYYCVVNYVGVRSEISISHFFEKLWLLAVYLLLMVLVDFIVKRNRINKPNTYAILLFALFTTWFPDILRNGKILLSGFFVLLAIRRIISLKSGIDIKKKIFDAAFWICMAGLFFQWSLLFFVMLFVSVLFYAANDYRNWLVPIVAMAGVLMLATCFSLLTTGSFLEWEQFFSAPSWGFEPYNSMSVLVPLVVFCLFSALVSVHYLFLAQNAPTTMKPSMALILGIWATAFLLVFCSPKMQGELLFLIFPTTVIGANYFQSEGRKRLKNILLLLLIVLTVVFPFVWG